MISADLQIFAEGRRAHMSRSQTASSLVCGLFALSPVMGASGSNNGTIQVWGPRCEGGKCMAAVQPSVRRSPVCCEDFNPIGGALVAVGCAGRRVCGYDIRKMEDPVVMRPLSTPKRSCT
jgi:WD40 repeat protein